MNMTKNPLTNAFVTGNLENFKRLVDSGILDKEIDESTGISLFEKLCKTPKSGAFIKVCLQKFASDPNFLINHFMPTEKSDESNKYPIHFAAESLCAENLRVLLDFDKRVANPTNCSELTPLHTVINSLTDSNVDQIFEAMKILLEADADMNCTSYRASFHTPFTLLLEKLPTLSDVKKQREIMKYVEEHCLYLDITPHPQRMNNTVETLQEHFPDLLARLRTDDYSNMNEIQIYEKLTEHLDKGQNKFFQELCTLNANQDYNETIFRILKDGKLYEEAVMKGQYESVRKLIDMGANPVGYTDVQDRESALMLACKHGYWRILQLMLDRAPMYEFRKIKSPLLHYIVRNTKVPDKPSNDVDYYKCFDLIINRPGIDINEMDDQDVTVLWCAVNAQNVVYTKKILEKSAYIGYMNIYVENKHIPDIPLLENIAPEILENYFDSCITSDCYSPGEDKFELKIDYSCLVSPAVKLQHFVGELRPINYMATSKRYQNLVSHPLFTSLMYLKWFRMNPFFYMNILLYSIGFAAITAYIVIYYGHESTNGAGRWVVWSLALVFAVLYLLLRELFQLMATPGHYFFKLDNYFEITLILLMALVLAPERLFSDAVRRGLGGVTILFAVAELLLLIGSLPVFSMSTNVVLLKKVTLTFLNICSIYALILFACGLAFYTIFGYYGERAKNCAKSKAKGCNDPDKEFNNFMEVGLAMFKTFIMLAGEFETSQIDFQGNVIAYLVFVGFVMFASIVMVNLLVGLAITDTQMIRHQATKNSWLLRAQHLSKYEDKILNMKFKWLNIIFFPKLMPTNSIIIKVRQPFNEILIPQSYANGISKQYRKKMVYMRQNATMDDDIIVAAKRVLEKQQYKKVLIRGSIDERLDNIENKLNGLLMNG